MAAPDITGMGSHDTAPALPQRHFDWEEQVLTSDHELTVLIVDDVEINRQVLRAILKGSSYRVLQARRPSEAFEVLQQERVDLVIVDMVLPELSGPEFCRRMKADRDTHLIPILMVTSTQGVDDEIAGISSGANEFLMKPLHPAAVRARIRSMLRHKLAIDSLDEAETILFGVAEAVEQRDQGTSDHCQRLSAYSVQLGKALGLPAPQLLALHRGGFLHDIGKIGVPDGILFKAGRLTPEEWAVMQTHTVRGEEICRPMKSLAAVLPIIRSHHERWDGSGYPDKLRGDEIPQLARILQVADIYDALTSERSYKPMLSHQEAMGILAEETAKGWRDREIVTAFQDITFSPIEFPLAAPQSRTLRSLDNMRLQLLK